FDFLKNQDPTDLTVGRLLFYPKGQAFPATAFLRMNGSITDGAGSARSATLELYDPLRVVGTPVAGRQVPLESDLTTPLGYSLSRGKFGNVALKGLFDGQQLVDRSGLYMLHPYDKGKIPVVMVHGLWSSPLTWMHAFNDLQADPVLRSRYQFWFLFYPTGNPIPLSAALLRSSLAQARWAFDPDGADPALDQMVLVGHSMGGLLSKMMLQSSGDELWKIVANRPIDELNADEREIDRLRRLYFFEPQPYVGRVIFLATPHQGSPLANRLIGRLGAFFIRLPQGIVKARNELARDNPDFFTQRYKRLPTSIDNLSPNDPILQTVARLPLDGAVPLHSIIANRPGAPPPPNGSDGVVKYPSAHLDQAESEVVVPAGHVCNNHPLAILEMRRILLEHLKAVDGGR
ncbi:MAG: esterase/lipase family protein, partial [Planctomycetia bacterium]